ncbi:hypothetical protein [Streptomyces sp. UH6]|uniref:hypothetical protein n=1 Tax=Streptomyces sp. UH6 TaxID=2748379 RepID=UPI0015D487E4|nr:hypothetical protein [Streptomyces sp. UH6]NYV74968.1 hypothetical protein [Streptomyces sp. UH6]
MTNKHRWAARSRLPLLVDALALGTADEPVRRLIRAFGGEPTSVTERDLGEPVLRVRKLRFASGGEIVLHHDTVAAVILHVKAAADRRGTDGLGADNLGVVDLAQWVEGLTNDATLAELKAALALPVHFSGLSSPYFTLGSGHARLRFVHGDGHSGGWNQPGRLARIVVTVDRPGLGLPPDADACPACTALLVRGDNGVDVDATLLRLEGAVAAKTLKEDASWVKLADLRALHASRLMTLVESHLTCTSCRHVICFTLYGDGSPTFGHYAVDDARRRPVEPIPPAGQWGSEERLLAERDAMRYLDHQPGAWFLVQQGDSLYLDARYSYSAVIDDSALIELDPSEREAYSKGGHEYLRRLARKIHMSAPYTPDSPYFARDLYRRGGEPGRDYRSEVTSAIAHHTWLVEQRSRPT